MAYYDSIAKKWHEITGRSGGAFKHFVLNQSLLDAIGSVDGKATLELGAGNGYLMPMRRLRVSFRPQSPAVSQGVVAYLIAGTSLSLWKD